MDAATCERISDWFDRGVEIGATHMLVVCDTFNYEDYPIYAHGDENARKEHDAHDTRSMQRVMEVYDLRMSKSDQMNARRAFNLQSRPSA